MKRRNYILIALFALVSLTACKAKEEIKDKKHPPQDEFRTTFHQAIQEKMRGNYDVAVDLCEKCLGYNDESDAVHFMLSDMYELLKVPNKPLEHALRAHQIDSENKWYQMRLATIYFNKGDYHSSAKYYAMFIEDEKNIDVKFKYAESLIYSRQYKKAIAALDEIEVETGKVPNISLTKHDMYIELGDPVAAKEELDALIEDNPSNLENRLVVADYFLRTQQIDKAEKIARESLELAPENGELHLILADIELRKDHLEKCFDHLNIGFESDDVLLSTKLSLVGGLQQYAFDGTDDGILIEEGLEELYRIIYDEEAKNDTLHAQYGYFLQMQNKPLEAIAQYEKVVEINPDSYESWMQLMYSQFNIEDYEGMYESSKKATELFPEQPSVWMLAGISAYETEHFDDAEEWIYYGEGIVVKDPALSSEFVHQKGKIAWAQKDYESAHKYFDEAKTLDAFNGNVFYSKALCLADQGKFDEAIAEADDALNNAPKNPFFHDLKGMVYTKAEKFTEAQKSFDNALIYEPNNAKFHEHYGDLLFKKGEKTKALERWEKAMELGGYNATLKKKIDTKTYHEQ